MKVSSATLISVSVLLLIFSSVGVQANDMQRLFYEFSGNLGNAVAMLELQGITQANVNDFNASLQRAINTLNVIIENYQDPPYDVQMIIRIRDKLMRFNEQAQRLNNKARVAYLNTAFSSFRQAMSYVYDSRQGIRYCPTCDTFVADLGFYLARARVAGILGATSVYNASVARVNQAIINGIEASNNILCGFLSREQWQATGWRSVNSAQAITNVIGLTGGYVSTAFSLDNAQLSTPSSPVRTTNVHRGGDSLEGSWRTRVGTTIKFRKEGNEIKGYLHDLSAQHRDMLGYTEGELCWVMTSQGNNVYKGKSKWRWANGKVIWADSKIVLSGDTIKAEEHSPETSMNFEASRVQ